MNQPDRVLGIDPGSRYTGYGIVEGDGNRLCHVSNGTIVLPSTLPLTQRLRIIFDRLSSLIHQDSPACVAIEEIFFAKNVKSALSLGQARGAAVLAAVNAGLTVYEYSALQVKQAVVGYGRAEKTQVLQMIQTLFRLQGPLNPNAADALAIAVCHLNTHSSKLRWNMGSLL
jgi:crossover junction endodeoxyribonuclease RuvC